MGSEEYVPKGAPVRCKQGHIMGTVARDLRRGQINTWANAFTWVNVVSQPTEGGLRPRCKTCGEEVDVPLPKVPG